ncbi:MAG: hypothetical protein RBT60_02805 [Candidatus Krumholzibacteria bacterium]|jgi:hypothetical protein|nr:hypothetical protein [Candidatus Krumholzibacteria bacterium]
MPADVSRLLVQLSRADLQNLLAAKVEIEELQERRAVLQKELGTIENALLRLLGKAAGAHGRGKKRKQVPAKSAKSAKPAKKKKAAKRKLAKQAKKRVAKRPAGTARKGKPSVTASGRAAGGRITLEDVVVSVLKRHGEPLPFKVLLQTIVGGRLFKTRSANFENVLRRTLSTSKRVKRVGRGVYGL